MQITLNIEGKDKSFTVPFVSGRAMRKALEIAKKSNLNDIDVETLDTLVDYVVDLFRGQFTRDEYYDGIEAQKLLSSVMDCINEVLGRTQKAAEGLADPNVQ